ncbi:MAG: glutamate synthase subunit beta [Myxococcota bacterium]
MGKPTGFIEWERLLAPRRAVELRTQDFAEVERGATPEHTRQQAGRCMDCGIPFCQQGCPLGNPIPDFNDAVYRGDFESAYRLLSSTNNFPEFTGRLCPAPCESACTLALAGAAVTIEQVEKEIAERAWREGWVDLTPYRTPTGNDVGVVGSGPAGLAAAEQLVRAGHRVTVYERDDRVGGLLRYGIPDFKLARSVLDRRLALMEAAGVTFTTGVAAGEDVPWSTLRARHDALLLALGSRRPRDLDVPGRSLSGVVFAMDFLEPQNRRVVGEDVVSAAVATGRRVVILGGGDTGSDCLGTCHRQGAAAVTQVELMPAPPSSRAGDNPWPQWPMVFRTSSSQEEGGERRFAFATQRLEGVDGRLTHLVGAEVRHPPGGGLEVVAGTERRLECDLLILAMGFVGPDLTGLPDALGVALDARGNVAADEETYATSVPGVFVAGDARRGQSLVVWAIREGREAARAIDAQLTGAPSVLPSLGADAPFS